MNLQKNGEYPISAACTFSGCIESDPSAKSYGEKREPYTYEDFVTIGKVMDDLNTLSALAKETNLDIDVGEPITYKIINLADYVVGDCAQDAYVMQIDNFIDKDTVDEMWKELNQLRYEETDHHMWSYGKCKVKNARINGNLGDVRQSGDISNEDKTKRNSTIWHYDDFPSFKTVRMMFNQLGIEKMKNLFCELNFYFPKGGIGEHGDRERNQVMCVNLSPGTTRPIQFRAWHKNQPVSELVTFDLPHGSMYLMDGKATGSDFKKSSMVTYRHRAGAGDGVFLKQADKVMARRKRKRGWNDIKQVYNKK